MNKVEIKKYFTENPNVAVEVARDLNWWDGSFPEFDCYYIGDMVDYMCGDHQTTLNFLEDIIFAAKSGEFNNYCDDDFIRYDDFSRLEVRSQNDLEEEVIDYLNDIIDALEENYPSHIDIYDDGLKELLEGENEDENAETAEE